MFKILKKINFYLLAVLLSVSFLLPPAKVGALSASDYERELDYQQQIAEQARKQAAQKGVMADQIEAQVGLVTVEINKTQSAITSTNNQINGTTKSIKDLEAKIKTEEDKLEIAKDKLGQIISSWYMEGDSGLFEAILSSNTLSEVVDRQQYYEAVRNQIQSEIKKISDMKSELDRQKREQQTQLSSLSEMRSNQIAQQSDLVSKKAVKNSLLNDANSAIDSLNNQAAQAEAKAGEIRQILARIYSSGSGTPQGDSLFSSVDSGWYYNQRDYSTRLYPSYLTIAEVGCLITSYAMVATKVTGRTITPPDIVNASTFNTSGSWLWFNESIGVSFYTKVPVNWDTINYELSHGRPVIVSVKVPGTTVDYNGDGSNHWIVIKGFSGGKYIIHDPYWRNSSYSISDVKSMKTIKR